jgi:uncharacterized membrane-anchored protein YitT (DUF2179 family)
MTKKTSLRDNLRLERLLLMDNFKSMAFILLGIALATIGLKGFLLPNDFLDGGATGIALMMNRLYDIDISIMIVVINIPFIFMGYRQIGSGFALKTAVAVSILAIAVHEIELPEITTDPLLISIFGGFFLGAGIGLTIRGRAVIDGTEVLAVAVSRNSSLSVGDFIAIFNVFLFTAAAFLIDLETAMYSMLTYLAASKTVDFVITGIEEYVGVTIISEEADLIHEAIIENLRMAVTVYKGEGGFGKKGKQLEERKILYSVVTRLEVQKLKLEIDKIDPEAFVVQHTINDTRGGMIKKRPLH